jgi:hypothetical protein
VNTFSRNLFTGLQPKSPADLVYNRECNDGKKKKGAFQNISVSTKSMYLVAVNKQASAAATLHVSERQ